MKAIPHIVHDVVVLDVSSRSLDQRIAWVSWYVMARNLAIFFEVPPGRRGDKDDIKASEYFEPGSEPLKRWRACRKARLETPPSELRDLHPDASRAAAHLSWKRIEGPMYLLPSIEISRFLSSLYSDFYKCVPRPFRRRFLEAQLDLSLDPEHEEWGWLLHWPVPQVCPEPRDTTESQ